MNIISTGMVCPVGLTAEAACVAMRAGVSMFEELPYCDNHGEPIIGAVVPQLDLDCELHLRYIKMLTKAVGECLAKVPQLAVEKLPLLVALAESGRPGNPSRLEELIIRQVQSRLGVKFHPELSRVISTGHTAGFEALGVAREIMKLREVPTCLVCAVDSYIRARSLLWLDQHWRLKTDDNSDGVIPGEAAAAVLVCANQITSSATSVHITGLGFGTEPATVMTEEPLLGRGLTEAARAALGEACIQMHEVDFRIVDVNGESYSFKEQALVVARLYRVRRKVSPPLWHCAENIGETGAAAGIIQLIMASYAFEKAYAPGEIAMCSTSADSGGRAVAVISRNVSPPPEQRA